MSGRNNNRSGGAGPPSELISSVIFPVIVFAVLMTVDYLYRASSDKSLRFITVIDYTANSADGIIKIPQNPTTLNAIQLGTSVNERTGVEFAYSFFLNVAQATFSGNDELFHVFHKGYVAPWPLLGPGVFISGLTNTMKVVMNMNTHVFMSADVTNIPVAKWFHVVLNCYKSGLDIYINGNLAHRIPFSGGVIYQNFQDLIVFSTAKFSVNPTQTPAIGDTTVQFSGPFQGQLSSMKYARYALSLKEIQGLMAEGPSSNLKTLSITNDTSYLSDTWWANQ